MSEKKTSIRDSLKGQRMRYGAAVAFMVLSVLAAFLTPLILGETIDALIGQTRSLNLPIFVDAWVIERGGRDFLAQNLWIVGAVMVAISAFGGACQYLRVRLSAEASERIAENLRNGLYAHIQRLPYAWHVKTQTGDIIQRATSDVETVRKFLATQLVEVFRTALMLVVSIAVMAAINFKLTLASLVLMGPLFLLALWFFGRVRKDFERVDAAEGKMSAVLQENLAGVRVVRAFGRQAFEIAKFEKAGAALFEASRRLSDLMAAFWPAGDLISLMQTGITLVYGIRLAAVGELTVGEITVFVSYVSMLTWPVRQLGRILSDLGKASVSLGRINQVMRALPEEEEKDALEMPLDGDIAFEDVGFGYEKGHAVLQGVSFRVKAGQTVAILGGTGSGKSTLMLMLQRLYEPDSGRISIGGIDIQRIAKPYLRRRVGLILQEPFLYSRTLKENIAFAQPSATDQEVIAAARTASADAFIRSFDKGYDTLVGERGVTLSGGQKQRVAIARTLLKDSDILIFDDSLSAVDTETDQKIRSALMRRAGKKTTFIISHRVSTLSQADVIVVIDKGRVAEMGTHEELIGMNGLYSRVYMIQSLLEEELNASV